MKEELLDYIRAIKANPDERDEQASFYVEEIKTIHDDVYENGINIYHSNIQTLLLSFFERISYIDSRLDIGTCYDAYSLYADILNVNPRGFKDYKVNAEKEKNENHLGAKGALDILVKVASTIKAPEFRVYLVLLAICLMKEINTSLSAKQKAFLEQIFDSLRIIVD